MPLALGLRKRVPDIVLDVLMEHDGLEDTGRVVLKSIWQSFSTSVTLV